MASTVKMSTRMGTSDLVNRGGAGRKHDAPGIDEQHGLFFWL